MKEVFELLSDLLKDHKENVIFNCFGIWHILYLLIIFGFIITISLFLKNKDSYVINVKKAIGSGIGSVEIIFE